MRALMLLLALPAQLAHTSTRSSTAGNSLADLLDEAAGRAPPTATGGKDAAPAQSAVARAFQSLNPDLAVIMDATAGASDHPASRLAGDDPDLKGGPANAPAGFTLQELEVSFQSTVDPYFKADAFLTIPNTEGIEVEEAYVTTTGLPFDLQLKAGVFRSALGRQNGQHLHVQDFTRRPLLNAAYLGADGLRPPGAQLSWLFPLPFFLQLDLEAFSVAPPDDLTQLSTFGGGRRQDLTYAAELKAFFPIGESLSAYAGVNGAVGRTAGLMTDHGLSFENARTHLIGGDLYIKLKPPNQADTYFSLAWQTEAFFRQTGLGDGAPFDGGLYSQLVAQLSRRWFLGLREDLLGLPGSIVQDRVSRTAVSLTFVPSEFARVRVYGEREIVAAETPSRQSSWGGYLQLEVAIGAHGAHAF